MRTLNLDRLKEGLPNVSKRGNLNLPVYVIVVEFGAPKAKIIVI
jgi:hypothetical protein